MQYLRKCAPLSHYRTLLRPELHRPNHLQRNSSWAQTHSCTDITEPIWAAQTGTSSSVSRNHKQYKMQNRWWRTKTEISGTQAECLFRSVLQVLEEQGQFLCFCYTLKTIAFEVKKFTWERSEFQLLHQLRKCHGLGLHGCLWRQWILIDDVTHDGSSRMNSEEFKNILSANLCRNASTLIGRNFIMKQDNDPKTGNTKNYLITEKK